MATTGFKRLFTDNNEYETYKDIDYLDSLAYTVQEFLYTSKAKSEEADYRMDKHIKLCDFMSVSVAFIKSLKTDFGRTAIKDYVEEIRKNNLPAFESEKIEDKYDVLIISRASNELVMALLWAPYIYANTHFQMIHSEYWDKTVKMIYDVMLEYSLYPAKQFKIHPLILLTDDATRVMKKHIYDNYSVDMEKEDMEQYSEQEEVEKPYYEEETKDIVDVAEEITLHDKVRLDLLLRLMKDNGANLDKHGNKTKAAKLMQSITGLPLQTCKNYCSDPHLNTTTHSEEVLNMNTLLQALDMKIHL